LPQGKKFALHRLTWSRFGSASNELNPCPKNRPSGRRNGSPIKTALSALRERGFLLLLTPRTYQFDALHFFKEQDHPKMVARAHKTHRNAGPTAHCHASE
jgi:hypothetical protein